MRRGILCQDGNLRTGPSMSYEKRSMVGRNRPVEILDKSGEWFKVRVLEGDSRGLVGWMHEDNIDADR
jgi:SH3-like domain-containing protein